MKDRKNLMGSGVQIIGAGIAGLTAALALRRAGFDCEIHERMTEFNQLGAGIILGPNAVHLLSILGVDLFSVGQPVTKVRTLDLRGRVIQESDLSRVTGSSPGALAFDRTELHQALIQALPSGFVQLGSPYKVEESFAEDRFLIGADGIYSTVRQKIAGPLAIRYSGCTCWRAICQNPGVDGAFEQWAGRSRIGVIPLTGNRIYVYLVRTAPQASPRSNNMAFIRNDFTFCSSEALRVVDALAETPLLHHDLEELARPVWGAGKTLLIGDAAHAMTPNLGQGAGMAIEDAFVLPATLQAPDPAAELKRIRHSRVLQLQRASRLLGQVAHWEHPWSCALRDCLLRAIPSWVSERQYARMIEQGISLSSRH
jgi:2-polyprenyl-6-methoxyphenol hydroxylase-like FAD-dependent oxidoreductase